MEGGREGGERKREGEGGTEGERGRNIIITNLVLSRN